MATAQSLAEALLDKSCDLGGRDDAAMDLGQYDEPIALEALIRVASDPTEVEMIHASAGESIGEIWRRAGVFDDAVFDGLTRMARFECASIMGLKDVLADRLR